MHGVALAMPSTLTKEQIMKLPTIEVRSSTAVEAFIPFTALPKGSRGKRYRLVECADDEGVPDLAETDDVPWALASLPILG